MIHAGASPKALQTVLGHGWAAFTLTVYGHVFDADLDGLAERLEAIHAPHTEPGRGRRDPRGASHCVTCAFEAPGERLELSTYGLTVRRSAS
jgi:hypothetical protein